MTDKTILELLPPELRDSGEYGEWEWLYYPEKDIHQDMFIICPEGKIYDVVAKKFVSSNFMGEARVKYANLRDYTGWPVRISVAKALLYTFVGLPPKGKNTKIKFLDCDRRNVTLINVRWDI